MVALGEVPCQHFGHEHKLVAIRVGGRVLILDGNGRAYRKVNPLAIHSSCRYKEQCDMKRYNRVLS